MNNQELEEWASEARAFVNSKVVQSIFDGLQREYVQQLVHAPVGDLTAVTAHASIKVLEDIRNRLRATIDEQKMRNKGRTKA